MKFILGAVSAAMIAATAAQAEPPAPPYRPVSDFDGPYADQPLPPPAPGPAPRYGYGPGYYGADRPDDRYPPPRPQQYAPDDGYAPAFLPVRELYGVLRDHGYSPLGAPRQRGNVYIVAVLDRDGEDGKLVVDAMSGRIIRFVPAFQWSGAYDRMRYAPSRDALDALPPPTVIRADPRIVPPAPVPAPRMASRAMTPAAPKLTAPATRSPAPGPGTASLNDKPGEAKPAARPPAPQTTAAVTQPPQAAPEQKPVPQILPTQVMPPVQDLE